MSLNVHPVAWTLVTHNDQLLQQRFNGLVCTTLTLITSTFDNIIMFLLISHLITTIRKRTTVVWDAGREWRYELHVTGARQQPLPLDNAAPACILQAEIWIWNTGMPYWLMMRPDSHIRIAAIQWREAGRTGGQRIHGWYDLYNFKPQASPSRCKTGWMSIIRLWVKFGTRQWQRGMLFHAKFKLDRYIVSPLWERGTHQEMR